MLTPLEYEEEANHIGLFVKIVGLVSFYAETPTGGLPLARRAWP